jgi:predicted CXXCH cytochrome family protein
MWRSLWPPKGETRASAGNWRDSFARLLALLTLVGLGTAFIVSNGTRFLMPGPLTSTHGAIKNCVTCHTASGSGSGKFSWMHGLVAGDPLADSKACLTCHKMPTTAFFPHGASAGALLQSTNRLTKIAAKTTAPLSARIQNTAVPSRDIVARGLFCSTCHKEHRGTNANLSTMSNEQCRSCHVLKFDSFDHGHPQFENYPFNRRTRIIYDHAAHFDKHFPEVAKKDASKHIPTTCSTCHNSRADKRIMGVAPFEQTCSGCHLNQITGKERASGPKGIAFLTLPGLDLQTLKKKNIPIGEWPDASEAELTPFMKVMISRSKKGRALIKIVNGLNIQDLSKASDDQITAAKDLVWEIKRLFYALISEKSSDVLSTLDIGGGTKLSANLGADLTAAIPRDVVLSAQEQWLPNLAREITTGPITATVQPIASEQDQSDSSAVIQEESPADDAPQAPPAFTQQTEDRKAPDKAKRDPPACLMRVFGQCLMSSGPDENAEVAQPEESASEAETAKTAGGKNNSSATDLPPPMQAGLKDVVELAESKAANQSDDLLFPTEKELRKIKARNKYGRR